MGVKKWCVFLFDFRYGFNCMTYFNVILTHTVAFRNIKIKKKK